VCTLKFKNGKDQLQNFIPEDGDGRSVKKGSSIALSFS